MAHRRPGCRSTTRSTPRSPAGCGPRSTRRWPGRARSSTCSSAAFGPYPFSHGRRHRRRPGRPVLRPRDPDAAGLLEALLARRRGKPGERRLGRRPRARPPVVRRQRRARAGGRTSGSTRASRPTPSGSGPSTRAQATPQEIFRATYDADSRRRPVLGRRDRRPRQSSSCSTSRSTSGAR